MGLKSLSLPIYKVLAFGISAAYAGVAGALFVLGTNGFAQPRRSGLLTRCNWSLHGAQRRESKEGPSESEYAARLVGLSHRSAIRFVALVFHSKPP